jgi:hypothetical protein
MSDISDYSQFATPREYIQRKTEDIFWLSPSNKGAPAVPNKTFISQIDQCMQWPVKHYQ